MPETEGLMQGLKDSGCSEETAARSCSGSGHPGLGDGAPARRQAGEAEAGV